MFMRQMYLTPTIPAPFQPFFRLCQLRKCPAAVRLAVAVGDGQRLPALALDKFQQFKRWGGARPSVFLHVFAILPVRRCAIAELFIVVSTAPAAILYSVMGRASVAVFMLIS